MNTAIATHRWWSLMTRWFCRCFAMTFELDGLDISEKDVLDDLATGCE